MTPPSPPPVATRGISPRKLILGAVLAGSILFFFLILFAGGIAILREAAPKGNTGLGSLYLGVRHAIGHHFSFHHHK